MSAGRRSRRSSIHTDGACSGNPGPGGWGVDSASRSDRKELKGGEACTTNNRMELMAAIMALEALKRAVARRTSTPTRAICASGITEWIQGGSANGWKTADKKPVKNHRSVAAAQSRLRASRRCAGIGSRATRGHDLQNERADELAREGMVPFLKHRKRKAEDD